MESELYIGGAYSSYNIYFLIILTLPYLTCSHLLSYLLYCIVLYCLVLSCLVLYYTRSSKVILTNRDMQDWARCSQWWGKSPPLLFLNSAEFSVVKKIKVAWEGIDIHSIRLGLGWGGCGGFFKFKDRSESIFIC